MENPLIWAVIIVFLAVVIVRKAVVIVVGQTKIFPMKIHVCIEITDDRIRTNFIGTGFAKIKEAERFAALRTAFCFIEQNR